MKLLRSTYLAYFSLVFLITMVVFYPLFKWSVANPSKHGFSYKLSRFVARVILRFGGMFMKKKHSIALPNEPVIFCPNHTSYIDILTMYALSERPLIFLGKKELETWPFIKLFFKGKHVLVDRNNPRAAQKSLEQLKAKLEDGFDVVIFPEGGIWKNTPKLKPFKMGAFKLSKETGAPIVPVVFYDNWRRFSFKQKGWRLSPGSLRYSVFPIIDSPKDDTQDLLPLRDEVYGVLDRALNEHVWKSQTH